MPLTPSSTSAGEGATLSDLRTELQARGYDYLSVARCNRYINRAYQELCEAYQWPFLEQSAIGAAPLALDDIRQVLSVHDATQGRPLRYMDRRLLVAHFVDLTQVGTPEYWYFEDYELRVYPASTSNTIAVRYIAVPPQLVADGDRTVVPLRYSDIIVDGAVIRALKDSDNFELLTPLRAEYDRAVMGMATNLMLRHYDGPGTVQRTQGHEGF